MITLQILFPLAIIKYMKFLVKGQTKFSWRRISQSEIRNSAAAESEGGQKFLPPNPLPFCPPERSVWRAKRAVSSVQKRFGFRQTNAQRKTPALTGVFLCARGGIRTHMSLRSQHFKCCMYPIPSLGHTEARAGIEPT